MPKDASAVLVKVDGIPITENEYAAELEFMPQGLAEMEPSQKKEFLDIMVNRRLMLDEAIERGLDKDDKVVRLAERAKEEIVIQRLIDREISEKAQVPESEMREYFEKNKDRFVKPAQTRASHILLGSKVEAVKVKLDLDKGADFAELASKYSLDIPTKDKGGDLGYFSDGTFISEFEAACANLKVGEVSEPVETVLGYHIIKVADRIEAATRVLEEAKEDVRNEMFIGQQVELYDKLIAELRASANIEYAK